MTVRAGKKWLGPGVAVYLVFATLGLFTLTAVDNFDIDEFIEKRPLSSAFFTPIEQVIDCLAVGQTIVNKGRGYVQSSLRNGFLQAVMLAGVYAAGADPVYTAVKTIARIMRPEIQNPIILKLRI